MTAQLLGGIGLFLLGMTLLTDGLKSLAGDALRRALTRFTGGPLQAVFSGAAMTALVQSSSATTLATIGFVSAGLLTLPQAIGVVMGANLGTTSTAWLVSAVGLKFSMSEVALPMVGVGALARLLARDRLAAAGTAIAGFGLVFVGIATLQLAMSELATRFDPASLPGATFVGRLFLVFIGAVMTIVMQSSSAAVAATLTGVEAGTVSLIQAAALVIGQNVGTTVTAAIAVVKGSVPAQRTAVAHILFNVATGLVAMCLLPLFVKLVVDVGEVVTHGNPALTLALFHTVFNVLGVALLLPFMRPFCRLVERLVPERGPQLTRYLDPMVTRVPAVAVEAAQRSLVDITRLAFTSAIALLRGKAKEVGSVARGLTESKRALEQVLAFLAELRTESESQEAHARHLGLLYATDHLQRFIQAFMEFLALPAARDTLGLEAARLTLADALERALPWLDDPPRALAEGALAEHASWFDEERRAERATTLERTARGELGAEAASVRLDAMLRLNQAAHASYRALFHLSAPPQA